MRLGRFRARLTCLWLLLLDPRLLMLDLMTVWPNVSCDTTVMGGRLTLFGEMLFYRLCNFKVSILTQNKVLTLLRYMSLMGRDIFIKRRFCNITLFRSNLLIPRPVGFQ
jgi:hypothetical protein